MKKEKGRFKIGTAMLLCAGVLFFAGCGAKDGALKEDEAAGEEQAETAEGPILEEEDVSDTVNIENTMADSDGESAEKAYEAQIRHYYGGVLSQIVASRQLPDGEMDTWANGYEEMENNGFAVVDIDQDGRQELIIQNTDASMAGMFEMVYDYNPVSEELKREFCDFPALTYYDNGIIKAEWSHNQGPGEFLITGEGFGNISIWFSEEDNVVTEITAGPYCAFTG